MTAEPTAPEWLTEPLSKPARQSATLVDGCPIAIYEWGSLGDRPIVLLHGGAGHARWWSHIGPYLADDHHVITFDWSGHGDSGWREPDDYTREQWCRELFGVIESVQLRERPLVFGHSMGGLNLITAAHERGDDLAGMVILDAAVRTPEQVRDMRPGAVFRNPATYASKEIAQKRYRLVPPQPNGDPALMEYIPMNYKAGGETLPLEPLESFLKETGHRPEPLPRISVSRSGLPSDLTVMILEPK